MSDASAGVVSDAGEAGLDARHSEARVKHGNETTEPEKKGNRLYRRCCSPRGSTARQSSSDGRDAGEEADRALKTSLGLEAGVPGPAPAHRRRG
jgi:hypothetical protein